MRTQPKEKYGKLLHKDPETGNELREHRVFKEGKLASTKLNVFIGGRRKMMALGTPIKNKAEGVSLITTGV